MIKSECTASFATQNMGWKMSLTRFDMKEKTALVTGCGVGIGAATARRLRAADCNVVTTGRREQPLERIAAETGAIQVHGDVTTKSDFENAVNIAVDRFGGLDFYLTRDVILPVYL